MSSEKNNFKIKDGVTISEEVVATIAGLAATEIEGVESLYGNIKNQMVAKAGMKKLSKGIKVISEDENTLSVCVSINMSYGHGIPEVSKMVQEKIQTAIENMTGLKVNTIDVKITSVGVDK